MEKKRVNRIEATDLQLTFEEGIQRLERYQELRVELQMRLQRDKVFELLGLKNEREELEVALNYIEKQIHELENVKEHYELIFS